MSTPVPSSRVQYVNPDRTPTRALYYFLEGIASDLDNVATVTNVAAIVSTVSALQTTVTNLTTTVTNLATTVTALQTTVTALQTTVTALQITVTNLTTTVNNLGSEFNATLTSGAAVTVVSNVAVDIVSIGLPVGKWLCHGNVVFNPSATCVPGNLTGWITITSATNPTLPGSGSKAAFNLTSFSAGFNQAFPVGMQRIVSDGTVTAYLGATATFAPGTMKAYGYLQAIMVHN